MSTPTFVKLLNSAFINKKIIFLDVVYQIQQSQSSEELMMSYFRMFSIV